MDKEYCQKCYDRASKEDPKEEGAEYIVYPKGKVHIRKNETHYFCGLWWTEDDERID